MTQERRINPIIEEKKSGLQQEDANANQSINSQVENDYDLDMDAKGIIVLLAELLRMQDIIHNCSGLLRRR